MDEMDNNFNKKKRKRTAPEQLKVLEDIFNAHQHPNLSLRNQLAHQLGMTPRSVQIWFQNRRAKARNMEFNTSAGPTPSSLSIHSSPPSPPSTSPLDPTASSSLDESVYKSIYLATKTKVCTVTFMLIVQFSLSPRMMVLMMTLKRCILFGSNSCKPTIPHLPHPLPLLPQKTVHKSPPLIFLLPLLI